MWVFEMHLKCWLTVEVWVAPIVWAYWRGIKVGPPGQTWKMSKILPKRDFSYPVFTQKCVNYANFKIANNQHNSSAFIANTAFTSTLGWVKLPRMGNVTQPRVILPLTTLESIIENIYAIRNNKTCMFRPNFYLN